MTIKGPRKLTPQQEVSLREVRDSDEDYRQARRAVRARLEEQLARELSGFEQRRGSAVVASVEAGVPKSRIAREGLGTTSTNEVYEIMAAHNARKEHWAPELPAPWETIENEEKEN